uniref:Putative secreted protein n=1 Tax=Ixodes ricinus TaxID=34613 RepID=A0A6B0UV10_IXORI
MRSRSSIGTLDIFAFGLSAAAQPLDSGSRPSTSLFPLHRERPAEFFSAGITTKATVTSDPQMNGSGATHKQRKAGKRLQVSLCSPFPQAVPAKNRQNYSFCWQHCTYFFFVCRVRSQVKSVQVARSARPAGLYVLPWFCSNILTPEHW